MNKCPECASVLNEDDIVWVNPITKQATMMGEPYCVTCAPAEVY